MARASCLKHFFLGDDGCGFTATASVSLTSLETVQTFFSVCPTPAIAVPLRVTPQTPPNGPASDVTVFLKYDEILLADPKCPDYVSIKLMRDTIEWMCVAGYTFQPTMFPVHLAITTIHGQPELVFIMPPRFSEECSPMKQKRLEEGDLPSTTDVMVNLWLETVQEILVRCGFRYGIGEDYFSKVRDVSIPPKRTRKPRIGSTGIKRNLLEKAFVSLNDIIRTHAPTVRVHGRGLKRPAYGTSAGYDLPGPVDDMTMNPGDCKTYDTNVAIEVPRGCALMIKARSSALRRGLVIDGIVDYGFTGTIKVIVKNCSNETVELPNGLAIAQCIFIPVVHPNIIEVSDDVPLYESGSVRGTGENGSSDVFLPLSLVEEDEVPHPPTEKSPRGGVFP